MLRRSFPLILLSSMLVLSACNGASTVSESNDAASVAENPRASEGEQASEARDVTEVMVEDAPEAMREDPPEAMREDPPEVMREDPPAPADVFEISACQPIFFWDDSGSQTFYRCFNSEYPVFSTKGVCVDEHGLRRDCPNDSTPACRTTSDAGVLSCEEIGKQWCVATGSNNKVECPSGE